MIDIYEFVEQCKAEGMTSQEAMQELNKALYEREEAMIEAYYNDPIVNEGFHQQDIIDMYRRER